LIFFPDYFQQLCVVLAQVLLFDLECLGYLCDKINKQKQKKQKTKGESVHNGGRTSEEVRGEREEWGT
jgi:hypothetical protein